MNPKTDTIAAISTPAGVGGIAVVRLSGANAMAIALRHLSVSALEPRRATYCRFDELDDVVATYFPIAYTGEPTVEISCHGSLYIQQTLLTTLVGDGARLAEPGEYTMRAFLSGRMDLSQAEAVADLIDATTPQQHRLAVSQLRGGYAETLKELRRQLVDLTSLLELELDFSQEDVEFADRSQLRQLLSTINHQLSTLISTFALGNALKRGVPVAIVGEPNVGKSTLLNALLGDDRAIVSDIPGTTRDTIEETLTIDNITFRLIDTAGLRETDDSVECLGIERSRRAIDEASIVLHVVDCRDGGHPASYRQRTIVVMNKCDLAGTKKIPVTAGRISTVSVSALNGEGIDSLKQALRDSVDASVSTDTLLTNVRHRDALMRVQQALETVRRGLDDGLTADLLVVDLRDALYHLGSITGDVAGDEILSNIFSRFCIGK